jgi:Subtilase family
LSDAIALKTIAFVEETIMPYPYTPNMLPDDNGGYVILDNMVWPLDRHATDFVIEEDCDVAQDRIPILAQASQVAVKQMATKMCRVSLASQEKASLPQQRDELMDKVRQQFVAHHVYQVKDSAQEVKITDRVILELRENDPEELLAILQEYQLLLEDRDDNICLLRVTAYSNSNPMKIANALSQRKSVESCTPEMLFSMQARHAPAGELDVPTLVGQHPFFPKQWSLDTSASSDDRVMPNAGINVVEAWKALQGFGSSEIVIAVIDDCFDLVGHPAFKTTLVVQPHDAENIPADARHGTCTASIAVARGGKMLGVAPGCALQPIRIPFHPAVTPPVVRDALEIANQTAHVVNCSFATDVGPLPIVTGNRWFMKKVRNMIASGGKAKRGLIIVFSAGNENAPIFMSAAENKHGIKRLTAGNLGAPLEDLLPGTVVHGGYPEIPGVVVVGAISSRTRTAIYSNWGKAITVVAPSNNSPQEAPIIAANNQPGKGNPFAGIGADAEYTEGFGGTSAAAPIVSGVIGLMLSANPMLTPQDVCKILKETADKELDLTLNDDQKKNLQGLVPDFVNGQSIIFGGGKVNAARAVQAAKDMPH